MEQASTGITPARMPGSKISTSGII
uniref:Uncharacterized protein n=1 Tax=Rhizophora mucronata TaxID=61149 RepID=A0A2P2NZS8_RHIMU